MTQIDKLHAEAEKENEKREEEKKLKRRFLLNRDVSATSVEKIVLAIHDINEYDAEQESKDSNYVRKPIMLIVDSFGGSIYCGMLLVNTIESSETPVYGYCYSKAMSMGLAIFTACHKRFASPNATLMYHDAGTVLGGTVEGIQQSIDQTKRIVKRMDAKIVQYTEGKVTQKQLDRVKREKRNWYIFGDDALSLGLVDELLESTREKNRK